MRVLLMDDDAGNLYFLERKVRLALQKEETLEIVKCSKISDVKNVLREGKFDFAVLDWELEGDSHTNTYPVIQDCIENEIPVMVRTNYDAGTWVDGVYAGLTRDYERPITSREVDFYCVDRNRGMSSKLDMIPEDIAFFMREHKVSCTIDPEKE